MTEPTADPASPRPKDMTGIFRKCWIAGTADNNITLHGFRRFKTTHLLNLRFLEHEIAEMDHTIYQAGLSLGLDPSSTDRLGLKYGKKDTNCLNINDTITPDFILRLRDLLRQYDEAASAFNHIMAMETFSLLDDEKQSSLQDDLSLYEVYNTRLLRLDLGTRLRTDPFQRWFHKHLRAFRYWRVSRKHHNNEENLGSFFGRFPRWSYQNTTLLADVFGRVTAATFITVFLIVPLIILSYESSKNIQLIVVSICILILSFLVSLLLKASSFEMMAISAAYAAVLSVFVSNVPAGA